MLQKMTRNKGFCRQRCDIKNAKVIYQKAKYNWIGSKIAPLVNVS